MAEASIFATRAAVYYHDPKSGQWVSCDEGVSSLNVYKTPNPLAFRLVARKEKNVNDVVINSVINASLVHTKMSDNYQSWKSGQGHTYGLSFTEKSAADQFMTQVQNCVNQLKGGGGGAPAPPPAPRAPAAPAAPAAPKAPAPAPAAGGGGGDARAGLMAAIRGGKSLKKVTPPDTSVKGAGKIAGAGGGGGGGGGGAAAAPKPPAPAPAAGGGDLMAAIQAKARARKEREASGGGTPAAPAPAPRAPAPAPRAHAPAAAPAPRGQVSGSSSGGGASGSELAAFKAEILKAINDAKQEILAAINRR